jgi:hypothetical protein
MSLMGSNVAQSVSGLTQAERVESRAKRPAQKAADRGGSSDDTDQVVVSVETADAVRGLKSNDQEDAREDRSEQPGYTPSGSLHQGAKPPQLDVNG